MVQGRLGGAGLAAQGRGTEAGDPRRQTLREKVVRSP